MIAPFTYYLQRLGLRFSQDFFIIFFSALISTLLLAIGYYILAYLDIIRVDSYTIMQAQARVPAPVAAVRRMMPGRMRASKSRRISSHHAAPHNEHIPTSVPQMQRPSIQLQKQVSQNAPVQVLRPAARQSPSISTSHDKFRKKQLDKKKKRAEALKGFS